MSHWGKKTGIDRRVFIRHPVSLTVHCQKQGHVDVADHEIRDISFGGMYFVSAEAYVPGDMVTMDFPALTVRSRIGGEIIWSSPLDREDGGKFANGLKFLNKQVLLLARMIEQMCCIEKYRQARVAHGQPGITGDQAALEWIRSCAARFPGAA